MAAFLRWSSSRRIKSCWPWWAGSCSSTSSSWTESSKAAWLGCPTVTGLKQSKKVKWEKKRDFFALEMNGEVKRWKSWGCNWRILKMNQSFGLLVVRYEIVSFFFLFLFFFVIRQNPWCAETHSQHLSPWQPVHPGQRAMEANQWRRYRQVMWPQPLRSLPLDLLRSDPIFFIDDLCYWKIKYLAILKVKSISLGRRALFFALSQAARRHGDRRVREHRLPALGHALPVHADGQPDHPGPAQCAVVGCRHSAAGRRHLHVCPVRRPPHRHREYERWERATETPPVCWCVAERRRSRRRRGRGVIQ